MYVQVNCPNAISIEDDGQKMKQTKVKDYVYQFDLENSNKLIGKQLYEDTQTLWPIMQNL